MTDSTYMSHDPDLDPKCGVAKPFDYSAQKALVVKWRKDADQYQKQVEEARRLKTPHDQMLAATTYLRQCAKELEETLKEPT